jgi:hypothetical protein
MISGILILTIFLSDDVYRTALRIRSFGNNGIVTEYFDGSNCEAQVIFQQHDSKILLGGKLNNDFAVVRYNHFGMLDTTFANGGKFSTNVANAYQLNAIAELKDNTIILAGYGLYLGNQDCSPLL